MSRRRLVAGILSGTVLGLCALLLPSLHKSTNAVPAPAKQLAKPAEVVNSPAAAEPPAISPPVVAAEESPRPVASQTSSALPDVDPRLAFGSKTAPVAVEIFSDFQCPACKTLYLGTNRQLMDNYVNTGKVYLVHRDFPLPLHAHSHVAARYARAAAQIGKFEQVEEALYQNQEKWEKTGDVDGTVAAALTPAEMSKVRALVKGGSLEASIEKDIALGHMYKVMQTPTTIFHAKDQTYPYAGPLSYEILRQFLDQLLSQR